MPESTDDTDLLEIGDEIRNRISGSVEAQLLRSAELGFLGPMPVDDQIDHAFGFVAAIESELGSSPRSVVDLGTGGGLPGLVLIACWPDTSFLLLDANERRTEFLEREIERFGQRDQVSVVRNRAEAAGHDHQYREQAEVVVARSFGSPGATVECGSPLVAVGGRMVVSEPPDGTNPVRWSAEGIAQLGLEGSQRYRYHGRFSYQALKKIQSCDERFPRRIGVPAKRPLF